LIVNYAIFLLSTGRCGTQWVASYLEREQSDRVWVEHEPLHNRYSPRKMLGSRDPSSLGPKLSGPILSHVSDIERRLETRTYVECGHPCWSAIPYLADQLKRRVRVVHLVRHPIPTALSWLTHQAYCPPLAPHLEEKVLLSPFDRGIQFEEYRDGWDELTPYEKALYYWAEVNAYALRLEEELDAPWLRIKYEDLFWGQGLERFTEFVGLPLAGTGLESKRRLVDEYRYVTDAWWDWRLIENHPRVLEIARQLGYDPLDVDEMFLRERYLWGKTES
jgi:hypothetical protein